MRIKITLLRANSHWDENGELTEQKNFLFDKVELVEFKEGAVSIFFKKYSSPGFFNLSQIKQFEILEGDNDGSKEERTSKDSV